MLILHVTGDSITKINFNRQAQHLTIHYVEEDDEGEKHAVDVDIRFGDIIEADGRRLSYIGNKQWVGQDQFEKFDFKHPEIITAEEIWAYRSFKKVEKKLSQIDMDKFIGYEESYDSADDTASSDDAQSSVYIHYDKYNNLNRNGFLNIMGNVVKIFLMFFSAFVVGIITFIISVYVGYTIWDYNIRKFKELLQKHLAKQKLQNIQQYHDE